jgi:hypothetical protein
MVTAKEGRSFEVSGTVFQHYENLNKMDFDDIGQNILKVTEDQGGNLKIGDGDG